MCGLTFFAALGRPAIADSDEAFYAESAREMVETGDWLTPYYNYDTRFQKPVLFYWFVALGYVLLGVSETAARMPSALAGLGLVLVTWAVGRRWCHPDTGWIAGLVAATSFGYFSMARQSLPDLPLAFFVTLAVWTTFEAASDHAGRERRRWLLVSGAALAAAILTKGPVGIVVVLLAVVPVLAWEARGAGWWTPLAVLRVLPARDVIAAAALCVGIAAPWYGAMAIEHGPGYLWNFFIGENVERFATSRFNEPRQLWFYIPIVAGGLFPWTPLALLWVDTIRRLWRRTRTLAATEIRLLAWFVVPLVFFTISIGKQPRYILPLLPPLAILLADTVRRRLQPTGTDRQLARAGTLAGAVLLVLGFGLFRLSSLAIVAAPWAQRAGAVGLIGGGVALVVVAWSRAQRRLVPTLAAVTIVGLLAVQYGVLAQPRPAAVERVAAAIAEHRVGYQAVGAFGVMVRNLVFYTRVRQTDLFNEQRAVDVLQSDTPILLVVRQRDLERIERRRGLSPRRLAQVAHVDIAGLRIGSLLTPAPENLGDTVWLVTNR